MRIQVTVILHLHSCANGRILEGSAGEESVKQFFCNPIELNSKLKDILRITNNEKETFWVIHQVIIPEN